MTVKELVLSATLRIGLDKGAATQGNAALRSFKKELDDLTAHAENLRQVLREGPGAGIDSETLAQVRASLLDTEDQMKNLGDTLSEQIDKVFAKADRALYKVERIGMNLFQAAGALQEISQVLTFEDQMRQFEQMAATGDKIAKQNADLNNSIARSQARVGRVVAEAWTPILRQTDQFQQNIAAFVEANPQLLQIAVNVGSVISTLSGVANAIGRGLRIYADIKQVQISTTQLLAANIMEAAANKQLEAAGIEAATSKTNTGGGGVMALLGKIGAVIGGVTLGAGIYDAMIGKSQGQTAGNILGQGAAIFNRNLTLQLTGNAAQANKAFTDTARLYGVIADEGQAANSTLADTTTGIENFTLKLVIASRQLQKNADYLGSGLIAKALGAVVDQIAAISASTDPAVRAYADYREQVLEAEQATNESRARIILDGEKDRLRAMQDAQKNFQDAQTALEAGQTAERLDLFKQEALNTKQLLADRLKAQLAFDQAEADTEREAREQRLQDLQTFAQDEAKTEQRENKDRLKALADFAKSEAVTEQDRQRQRLKDLADFIRSEAETEQDYYAQRVKDTLANQREDAQQQADHDKQMLRMSQDYLDSLGDLENERDAFGLIRARREHDKERGRAEQDYADQVAQRNAQRAQQLADQEADFVAQRDKRRAEFDRRNAEDAAEQARLKDERQKQFDEQLAEQRAANVEARAERLADFRARLDDEDIQLAEARAKRLQDFEQQRAEQLQEAEANRLDRRKQLAERQLEQRQEFATQQADRLNQFAQVLAQSRADQRTRLDELDAQTVAEAAKRERDFKDRLNEIDDSLTGERDTRRAYYKQMADDLEAWLGGLRSNTEQLVESVKLSAQDILKLGQDVIANATQGVTGLFGGASANAPIGAFAGAQASGSALVLQQNFSFNSSLNESEKAWYKQTAYDQAVNAFDNVISGRK